MRMNMQMYRCFKATNYKLYHTYSLHGCNVKGTYMAAQWDTLPLKLFVRECGMGYFAKRVQRHQQLEERDRDTDEDSESGASEGSSALRVLTSEERMLAAAKSSVKAYMSRFGYAYWSADDDVCDLDATRPRDLAGQWDAMALKLFLAKHGAWHFGKLFTERSYWDRVIKDHGEREDYRLPPPGKATGLMERVGGYCAYASSGQAYASL